MATKKSDTSYRELNARLDDTLAKLQSPDLDIDEAAALYEDGLATIKQLEAHLRQAENKIQAIRAQFGGEPSASE